VFGWLKYLPTCNILFFFGFYSFEREKEDKEIEEEEERKKKKNPKATPSLHIRPEEKRKPIGFITDTIFTSKRFLFYAFSLSFHFTFFLK